MSELLRVRAILQAGSINRASNELCLSQPALTRRVRELEADLNAKLLERSSAGVGPTRYFDAISADLEEIESIVQRIGATIARTRHEARYTLRCGITSLSANLILPIAISALPKGGPLVIDIVEGHPSELIERLGDGKIDAFLGPMLVGKEHSELMRELLWEYEIGLFANVDQRFADPSDPIASCASDCTWIMPPRDSKALTDVEAMFKRRSLPAPENAVHVHDLALIQKLLGRPGTAAFAPVAYFDTDAGEGRVKRLELGERVLGSLNLYSKKGVLEAKPGALFAKAVRLAAGTIQERAGNTAGS